MGSHFIKYILKKYPAYKVVNFDLLTYAGNLQNLHEVEKNSNYTFVKGNICDEKAIAKVIKDHNISVIVNYAAETHVDRSIMNPKDFLLTDVVGSYTLLEAVKNYGLERMVQVSTDEVFGDIKMGLFTEESPFSPSSPYSASKAGGDHLCHAYFRTYNTPVVVTHSCNFYGPNQYPEKFIPLFITNLLEDKKVPVYGDGNQVREWIFVSDHCRAIDVVLHKGELGESYNIGTGNEMKNIETTKLLLELTGKDESYIEKVKDRPGHDVRYAVDHSKISRELGWQPKVSFSEGLKITVDWYKENQDWWKKAKSGEYKEYYKKQYEI